VPFDDGKKYVGVIISKGLKSGQWITCFEDGSEDKCADVASPTCLPAPQTLPNSFQTEQYLVHVDWLLHVYDFSSPMYGCGLAWVHGCFLWKEST